VKPAIPYLKNIEILGDEEEKSPIVQARETVIRNRGIEIALEPNPEAEEILKIVKEIIKSQEVDTLVAVLKHQGARIPPEDLGKMLLTTVSEYKKESPTQEISAMVNVFLHYCGKNIPDDSKVEALAQSRQNKDIRTIAVLLDHLKKNPIQIHDSSAPSPIVIGFSVRAINAENNRKTKKLIADASACNKVLLSPTAEDLLK
jgi:hypothetical protein